MNEEREAMLRFETFEEFMRWLLEPDDEDAERDHRVPRAGGAGRTAEDNPDRTPRVST